MATQISIPDSQTALKQIMEGIIGEICHQIDFSYGDELQLDFGEMTAYSHPKLAHLYKGSWQLGTRATEWTLKQNNKVLHKAHLLQEKKLNSFIVNANSMGLTLFFENDYQFILKPDLQDDSGLSYWELMMPNEQILIVGPGLSWQCKSIHDPV
jgi:hypothetical protein